MPDNPKIKFGIFPRLSSKSYVIVGQRELLWVKAAFPIVAVLCEMSNIKGEINGGFEVNVVVKHPSNTITVN